MMAVRLLPLVLTWTLRRWVTAGTLNSLCLVKCRRGGAWSVMQVNLVEKHRHWNAGSAQPPAKFAADCNGLQQAACS
jgi:hypothetical protein